MGLIACSTRNKKRCEVIGYESTRTRLCTTLLTYWLLIRITFGIPLSPHSFDSLDIGLSEENPIGRVSGSQTLSSLRDADCIMCIMTLHIIYLRVYSVRGRFFLHVCITWEYIHLAHSTRPYLLSSGQNENFIFKECSIPPTVNPLKPHIMISIQLGRWMHIICISTYSCWACRCNSRLNLSFDQHIITTTLTIIMIWGSCPYTYK